MKFQKNISAVKIIEASGLQNLLITIEISDNINDSLVLGNYQVDSDGALYGELDEYLKLYHKNFIPMAKKIMIESGLSDIIGDYIPYAEIFKDDFDDTSINQDIGKKVNRLEKALKYLEDNNIVIQKVYIKEYVR